MKKIFFLLLWIPFLGVSQTTLNQYKALYNAEWSQNDSVTLLNMARQNCGNDSFTQEIYFVGWRISGALHYWRATGDMVKFNTMLIGIEEMIKKAVPVFGGVYLGWPGNNGCDAVEFPNGAALWESYTWRHVTSALRIMKESPNLLTQAHGKGSRLPGTTYQDVYNSFLSWSEVNIWDKWEADGINNIYRSRTHIASHWMIIALNLYQMSPKQKYLTVYEDIAFDGMANWAGNSIRGQLETSATVATAYDWSSVWGNFPSNGDAFTGYRPQLRCYG